MSQWSAYDSSLQTLCKMHRTSYTKILQFTNQNITKIGEHAKKLGRWYEAYPEAHIQRNEVTGEWAREIHEREDDNQIHPLVADHRQTTSMGHSLHQQGKRSQPLMCRMTIPQPCPSALTLHRPSALPGPPQTHTVHI